MAGHLSGLIEKKDQMKHFVGASMPLLLHLYPHWLMQEHKLSKSTIEVIAPLFFASNSGRPTGDTCLIRKKGEDRLDVLDPKDVGFSGQEEIFIFPEKMMFSSFAQLALEQS